MLISPKNYSDTYYEIKSYLTKKRSFKHIVLLMKKKNLRLVQVIYIYNDNSTINRINR